MSERRRLDNAEIEAGLQDVPGWSVREGKLHRTFVFRDFVEAMGFWASAALLAERMNHHPEWSNVYKTVEVDLTTHSAGGITALDLELAAQMNRVAGATRGPREP